MKRNKIALVAASGLVGLSIPTGSVAFASTETNSQSAAELQQFLTANPDAAAAVSKVEMQTGGKVIGAEVDDEGGVTGILEFEIMLADGTKQDMLYTVADGTMTDVTAERDGDHQYQGANDNDTDGDENDSGEDD